MQSYIMAIDNGSQSTKVAIYDGEGTEMAFASHPLKELLTPEPGIVVHPDDDLWDSVQQAIEKCLKQFDGDRSKIVAIGLCTIRCCRLLVKEDGNLAHPAISWMDARLAKPYEHQDDRVKYVTTTSGYINLKLTGEYTDSAGNYEVHWPIDRETWDWAEDDQKIAELGLKREMLFSLVKPGEKMGGLRKELADRFGLREGTAVIATSNDKAVEALGAGIIDETTIMISLGTFISSMAIRKQDFEGASQFFPTLASIPHRFVYESTGIRRGLWTVSWFKRLIGEELSVQAKEQNVSEEEYLNQRAEEIPPGSEGLITMLDWLASPSQPYRKGIVIGFDQRHTRYHMYRSILEAIAFNIHNNVEDMVREADLTTETIVVIGGGSKSDVLMQVIADVFGKPAIRRNGSSGACIGATICAGVYSGIYETFEQGIRQLVSTETTFYPDQHRHEFYQQLNESVIKKVRIHTDEVLKLSYPLFN